MERTATNHLRRIRAMFMALAVMVLTVVSGIAALPAQAAVTNPKIRLTGIETGLKNRVWAYPIVLDTTDENGNHAWAYGDNIQQYLTDDQNNLTTAHLISIYMSLNTGANTDGNAHDGLGTAVVQDGKKGTSNTNVVAFTEDENNIGQYVSNNTVAPGLYVIAANNTDPSDTTRTSSKSYSFTLVSVNYTYGSNGQADGVVGGAGNQISPNSSNEIVANVKGSDTPELTKQVTDADGKNAANYGDAFIGDTVNFKITVQIPEYAGGWANAKLHYVVSDALTAGLSLNEDTIKVNGKSFDSFKATDNFEGAKTTITTSASGFTMNLYGKDVYEHRKITAAEGQTGQDGILTITYTATVTSSAGVNFDRSTNTATLQYTNTPNSEDLSTPIEKKTYHYTFGFDTTLNGNSGTTYNEITKVGTTSSSASSNVALQGAEFKLYRQNDTTKTALKFDASTGRYNPKSENDVLTSDSQGHLQVTGLDAGSYYLKESKAPEGYSLDTTEYPVVIAPTYNADGTLAKYEVHVGSGDNQKIFTHSISNNTVTTDRTDTFSIVNTPLANLPSTGARGIIVLTIAAIAMMAAFGFGFVMLKKNGRKQA